MQLHKHFRRLKFYIRLTATLVNESQKSADSVNTLGLLDVCNTIPVTNNGLAHSKKMELVFKKIQNSK